MIMGGKIDSSPNSDLAHTALCHCTTSLFTFSEKVFIIRLYLFQLALVILAIIFYHIIMGTYISIRYTFLWNYWVNYKLTHWKFNPYTMMIGYSTYITH